MHGSRRCPPPRWSHYAWRHPPSGPLLAVWPVSWRGPLASPDSDDSHVEPIDPLRDAELTDDALIRCPPTTTLPNPFGQLAAWRNAGVVVDGLYEIRLEMVDFAMNPLGVTDWHSCNKATPGDTVQGKFTATDPFFGSYSMNTLPASLAPPDPTHTPVSTNHQVPSGTWQLVTDGT